MTGQRRKTWISDAHVAIPGACAPEPFCPEAVSLRMEVGDEGQSITTLLLFPVIRIVFVNAFSSRISLVPL